MEDVMDFKRILTIQDISCVGQCSLTVALPILSACGLETAILPSAVLSTHTGGFTGYTFRDLTDDMPAIAKHWKDEGIDFDCVYTGYLGSTRQISYVMDIMNNLLKKGASKIVDPAMADNGKLYYGFDEAFVQEMKKLCAVADYILPNITEACFLTHHQYKDQYDEAYVKELLNKLSDICKGTIILTGVSYDEDTTGVVVFDGKEIKYYKHKKISKGCHGTGDIYSSAFVGALMHGHSAYDAAKIAADYTVKCIEITQQDPDHWYGARFEPVLGELIKEL
jgi:pyridoxine kinase